MDGKYTSISEFKQQLKEPGLVEEEIGHGWVLRQPAASKGGEEIQKRIIGLLKMAACGLSAGSHDYLIQFWAVVKGEGEQHAVGCMTTSEQPFCVGNGGLRKGVCRYRKQCMDRMYSVNMEAGSYGSFRKSDRRNGITPDVNTYFRHDLPLGLVAARSGFTAYSASLLCVFPSSHCCGVLEILFNSSATLLTLHHKLNQQLKLLKPPQDTMDGHFSSVFHQINETQPQGGTPSVARNPTSYGLLPGPLKLLCSYFVDELYDGRGIPIALDDEVFGEKCVVDIGLNDIIPCCDLNPFHQLRKLGNCMVVYIWNLYKKMKKENTLKRFMFVGPRNIYGKTVERVLTMRLKDASPHQLVLVPCNLSPNGNYWSLTLIEPYKNHVTFLDMNDDGTDNRRHWMMTVLAAMAQFKKHTNRNTTWMQVPRERRHSLPDITKRWNYYEMRWGYYVMHYMKELVQGLKTTDFPSFVVDHDLSQTHIDQVLTELAICVINHI